MTARPSRTAGAHGSRWRGCRCSSRSTASAPLSPAGTPAAAWKAELLSAAGARVESMRATIAERGMLALAADPPRGPIAIHDRGWRLATSPARRSPLPIALDDDDAPRDFAAAARAAGVPVNVIDKPAFCDFAFGAIVNRSPLVIGISTDGAAPVFAQAIRAKIEALMPKGFAAGPKPRARWRPRIKAWRCRFAAAAGSGSGSPRARSPRPTRADGDADLDALLTPCEPARGRAGFGHCGRRRPRRSGIADAARRARAAIGRRDLVRRSGFARHARFRAPRGEENAGRQDRQQWTRAAKTTSTP